MSATVSVGEHFKRLFDFRGNEDRASFWPYAAVAFIIIVVAGMVFFVPMMTHMTMAPYFIVSFGLAFLLYPAAVVRRLRDRGKTGFWGLMPLPFILYSTVQMARTLGPVGTGVQPETTFSFSIFFSNVLYVVTLIWLIVLLAGPSQQPSRRPD